MLESVSSGLGTMITMVGDVVSALVTDGGALAALLPLLAIGVSVSVLMFAFKAIRSVIWGA